MSEVFPNMSAGLSVTQELMTISIHVHGGSYIVFRKKAQDVNLDVLWSRLGEKTLGDTSSRLVDDGFSLLVGD